MRRPRGDASYSVLAPAVRQRRPWFRITLLAGPGWVALVAVCVAAGALGVLTARAIGLWPWLGALLAAAPVGVVVVLDRRRWAASSTSFSWGASAEEVTSVVEELRRRGVGTHLEVHPDPDRSHSPGSPGERTASLAYVNRDAETVRAVLLARGVRVPAVWW